MPAEPVESYFLKYAFPCTLVIKMRGQIDDKTYNYLEDCALDGKVVDRKLLEGVYKKAFARMKEVARELHADYWSREVVREYFINRHNAMIGADENYQNAPEALQDLCKTRKAKIVDERPGFFVVTFEGKTRSVSSAFVPQAKPGDSVIIHYGYAIEKA